jgi:hypothetical protein
LPYNVPISERDKHLYVIGTTGTGKSKFLESLMVADIMAGRAVGLVDPHTDLSRDTLQHLVSLGYFNQENGYRNVIYFDPTRSDYVIPFNVLHSNLPPYTVADMVIEAMRRAWPQALAEAPRFTNIALVCLLVLIQTQQSLVQMPLLLMDRSYRESVLARVQDQELVEFFHNRLDKWGRDGAAMVESVLNKVTAFTFNPHLKRLLGASENRLDFRRIMDEGTTLIVNLGGCDGETRRLIGSLIVTGIEQAALTRKSASARRPFYLFMDEFQDFCAGEGAVKTLAQILSECRKFGLYLHLAHQTLGQLNERLISALGNVGIKVSFTIDREDAEVMARKLFSVDTTQIKRAAQTDTQHPIYAPLPEQWERLVASLQQLPNRTAWVKRRARSPVRIKTRSIKPYTANSSDVEGVMDALVRRHGIPSAYIADKAIGLPGDMPKPGDWDRSQMSNLVYVAK